jgi:hypothetical protein
MWRIILKWVLEEMGFEIVNPFHMAQVRDYWRAFVNRVMMGG